MKYTLTNNMKNKKDKENGIYARCIVCNNPIYDFMKNNKEIFDETEMCGACATGEADTYIEEL